MQMQISRQNIHDFGYMQIFESFGNFSMVLIKISMYLFIIMNIDLHFVHVLQGFLLYDMLSCFWHLCVDVQI